jgi:hypothetical protein
MARRTPVDNWLMRIAGVSLFMAAAAVSWNVLSAPKSPRGYRAGDRLHAIEGIRNVAQPSLLIWLDSRCGACNLSTKLYRQLTASDVTIPVIVAGPEAREPLEKFLAGNDIHPRLTVPTNGEWYAFKGTPTILLLDSGGIVQRVWYGQITDPLVEGELMSIVKKQAVSAAKGD